MKIPNNAEFMAISKPTHFSNAVVDQSNPAGRVIPPPIQQKPSTGRIVHYFPDEDNTKWAAIITGVNNATNVDLHIFEPGKPSYPLVNVSQGNWRGEWNWPEKV